MKDDKRNASWLKDKLRQIATTAPAVLPTASKAKAKRTRKAKPVDPTICPPDIEPREWSEALTNVRNGSAPSAIKAGSDIPSDETVRRMQAYAERQRQQQKQQKRI